MAQSAQAKANSHAFNLIWAFVQKDRTKAIEVLEALLADLNADQPMPARQNVLMTCGQVLGWSIAQPD